MQNLTKKAISETITTVLLVGLAVIAVGIVAIFIHNLVSAPQFSPALNCLEAQTSLPVKIQTACYNSQTNELEVTVQRSLSKDIPSLEFVMSSADKSLAWSCRPGCGNCLLPEPGESKKYYFTLDEPLSSEEKSKMNLLIGSCALDEKEISFCNV